MSLMRDPILKLKNVDNPQKNKLAFSGSAIANGGGKGSGGGGGGGGGGV